MKPELIIAAFWLLVAGIAVLGLWCRHLAVRLYTLELRAEHEDQIAVDAAERHAQIYKQPYGRRE